MHGAAFTYDDLLAWIKGNYSAKGLPLSFWMLPAVNASLQNQMQTTGTDTANQLYQFYREGISTYDMALAHILFNRTEPRMRDHITSFLDYAGLGVYAEGALRAYYDPNNKGIEGFEYGDGISVTSARGRRGYFFRIINAFGNYTSVYHNSNTHQPVSVNWTYWQPFSGENAWIGMALLQAAHTKYGAVIDPNSTELVIAKELAAAATLLQWYQIQNGQATTWGIRMAPTNVNHNQDQTSFTVLSTEHNLSMRAFFSMLLTLTGDQQYQAVITGIDNYLKYIAFDKINNQFIAGVTVTGNTSAPNPVFASDCQSWAVLSLGPRKLDAMFGAGTSYNVLVQMIKRAGVFSNNGVLGGIEGGGTFVGLDYTDWRNNSQLGRNMPVRSIEWAAGAQQAMALASKYYAPTDAAKSQTLKDYEQALEKAINAESVPLKTKAGFAGFFYSSKIGFPYALEGGQPTGFGWNTPPLGTLSLASTAWVAFNNVPYWLIYRTYYNPFFLGGASPV